VGYHSKDGAIKNFVPTIAETNSTTVFMRKNGPFNAKSIAFF
jgi:hypothetical protein